MKNKKFQIGVIGDTVPYDYGLIATYLGLIQYLKKCGYNATIIPWGDKNKYNINIAPLFNDIYPIHKDYSKNFNEYINNVDLFIVGGGALWNDIEYSGDLANNLCFLDFLRNNGHKLTYSTTFKYSFPASLIANPEKIHKHSKCLQKIDYLGVNNESDIDILREYYDCIDSTIVLDAIFLPDTEFWENMIEDKAYNQDNNIVLYPIDKISRIKSVDKLSGYLNIPNIKIATGDPYIRGNLMNKTIVLDNVEFVNTPDSDFKFTDWLKYIYNCRYLVCSDYYSLCFAIIFKKNFVIFEEFEDERINYLIKKLSLDDRVVENHNYEKMVDLFNNTINYENIYDKLDKFKEESKNWLKNNIEMLL